jgi:hypothetical protein
MRQVQELEERPFKSGAAQTLADRVFSNNTDCQAPIRRRPIRPDSQPARDDVSVLPTGLAN